MQLADSGLLLALLFASQAATVLACSSSITTAVKATGASAYDTATLGFEGSTNIPNGTVNYTFFTNSNCSGAGTGAGGGALVSAAAAAGVAPNSKTEGPLAAGSYAFLATYSGDTNSPTPYAGSTSGCEPFTVVLGTSTTATVVVQSGTTTGASAYDTATVTTSDTIVASGTVSYTFFPNGTCAAGTGASMGTVTLDSSGKVPQSNTEGPPLAVGSYSFKATYSGDSNYSGSTSGCEPFTVVPGTSTTATTVKDATTGLAWIGTETTGASAYDTATVTTSDGSTPTGTVTYTFFPNGTCAADTGASAGTVTLDSSGNVPQSNTEGPLGAGSYAFEATYWIVVPVVYDGAINTAVEPAGSTSACEPFSVRTGGVRAVTSTTTATTVIDAATKAAWSGSETSGASAYDTATVTTSNGFTATGTVSYSFFSNGTCAGTPGATDTVTVNADGTVPNSSTEGPLAGGSYAFQATYSGDSNYAGSTSACEPFSVRTGGVRAVTSTTTATTVIDAATKAAWSGSETSGASAYDTATVTTSNGFTATGTVSYSFFSNGTCAGTPGATDTVTLTAAGLVPNSHTEGPLAAGSYAFQATYSGDSSYGGSTSACEPFSVATSTPTPAGAVAGITTPSTGAGSTAGGWGWLSLILVLVGGALLAGQWMIRRPKIKVQDII